MNDFVPYIWIAGGLQLVMFVVSLFLPARLRYRENLSKVLPIIQQIFTVHSIYISMLLLVLGVLCFLFAPELAGGSLLGRFFSGYLAVFWGLRVFIQLFYYDPELKRQNPLANMAFTLAFIYLCGVFTVAACGVFK